MAGAKEEKVLLLTQLVPSLEYSNVPDPVALTTAVPVGTAHVGCVNVTPDIVGAPGTVLIVCCVEVATQVGLETKRTEKV